jgi:hypothetical protein
VLYAGFRNYILKSNGFPFLMNELTTKLLGGAISGFMAALLVDLHAWQNDGFSFSWAKQFNWKMATGRWMLGLLSGAITASGFSAVAGG